MMARQRPHGTGCIFKRGGRGSWIAKWFDHTGRRCERSTRTIDKATAERILAKYVADAALRREGVVDAAGDKLRRELARPILEHVADFEADLTARGGTAKHVASTIAHVKRAINAMAAQTINDLAPSAVQVILGELRTAGLSVRTCNAHLISIKAFSRWLVRDGRIQADALQYLKAGNVDTDRRYERRDLAPDELAALIVAAEHGRPFVQMTGPDRAVLYRMAAGTGFRRSEIASLTPESFDLDASPPTITIEAAYSKRRREDVQPIRDDLAATLRPWLVDKPRGAPVFTLPDSTARMTQADLAAAGIAHRDDADRVLDFHSLRHTYISRVVESGVSVKVAQELARHSSPVLTIGRYSHVRLSDLSKALDGLPASESPDSQFNTMKATGTEDVRAGADSKPHHLPQQLGRETPPSVATACDEGESERQSSDARNPLGTVAICEDLRDDATGFDKATDRTREDAVPIITPSADNAGRFGPMGPESGRLIDTRLV